MPKPTILLAKGDYTIMRRFGYELWYRKTLLFVTPDLNEINEYLAWRQGD